MSRPRSDVSTPAGPTVSLAKYANVFEGIRFWSGSVPKGYRADFIGTMTAVDFEWQADKADLNTGTNYVGAPPSFVDDLDPTAEFWFEAANWVLAVREAKDRFVMMSLGANYGYQAVGCYRMLQQLNPMPCKLVTVDPIAVNVEWTKRHMRDNGIDPREHWLLQAALSDNNEPVIFPVGAPGVGSQNCVATNEANARKDHVREIAKLGKAEEALRNLLLTNSTGLSKDIVPEDREIYRTELKFVSALTLADILAPFDRVDYIEADMQQSEIVAFPPAIDVLKEKVKRIHIGTHGKDVHRSLHEMFEKNGWEIVFSFEPESTHVTDLDTFYVNDGVLTVRNPDI